MVDSVVVVVVVMIMINIRIPQQQEVFQVKH
jgi:hypothetical protein